MSDRIERPVFYEGQILGAADLEASVQYDRGQLARHERFLHLWGIAGGLELTGQKKTLASGAPYQEVQLEAGMAVDGTGREIVVPEAQIVSAEIFAQMNVAISDPDAWYPVFLIGRDESAAPPQLATGTCGSSRSVRFIEGFEYTFGRPGAEADLDIQDQPALTDPPQGRWRVLLGFVQWDAGIKRFKNVAPDFGGVSRRYAGVQADEVAARKGRLTLRTQTEIEAGKPALVLNESDEWPLQFGQITATGSVTPVFRVNAKGDVKAEGTLSGTLIGVLVESGVASDGAWLPLPAGIKQEQVDSGRVVLHIHVTPRFQGDVPLSLGAGDWLAAPIECRVEGRRVICRTRWFKLGMSADPQALPGTCDYTVLAFVSQA